MLWTLFFLTLHITTKKGYLSGKGKKVIKDCWYDLIFSGSAWPVLWQNTGARVPQFHQQAFPGHAHGQPWTCTVAPRGCNSGQRGNSISSPTRCLWIAASARDLLAHPLTFASTCYGRGLPHVSHLITLTTHTAFGPRGVNCCIHFWASWLIIRCGRQHAHPCSHAGTTLWGEAGITVCNFITTRFFFFSENSDPWTAPTFFFPPCGKIKNRFTDQLTRN